MIEFLIGLAAGAAGGAIAAVAFKQVGKVARQAEDEIRDVVDEAKDRRK